MSIDLEQEIPSPKGAVEPFIDGVLAESESQSRLEVTNPSNGKHLLTIPRGCESDVNRAVASGRRAVEDGRWASAPPSARKKVLHRLAELIAAEAKSLDILDAGEMGKPIQEVAANAAHAAGLMHFCAEAVDKVFGDVCTSDRNSLVVQRLVPRGVVAAIVPWNFPTANAVMKIGPALAAGNSVVLKPSELASRSAIRLAELATMAGIPVGVLNVVPGAGEIVGKALGLHDDVDMITFTGSTSVGKQLLIQAGQSNMKVVMAECGGKCPHVVFNDGVDLLSIAQSVARMLVKNQGQVCGAGSRLIVHRSIEDTLIEGIAAQLKNVVVGDALDARTNFGPLASAQQFARVMQYIGTAAADQAQLVMGGKRMLEGTGGYFVEPTLFRKVPPSARIAKEEIFGPVLSVFAFDHEEEAIRIANDTNYGLVAYVWTTSLNTAMRAAKGIQSSVLVNSVVPAGEGPGHGLSSEPAKQSGIRTEGGLQGLESYLRRQLVCVNHA